MNTQILDLSKLTNKPICLIMTQSFYEDVGTKFEKLNIEYPLPEHLFGMSIYINEEFLLEKFPDMALGCVIIEQDIYRKYCKNTEVDSNE